MTLKVIVLMHSTLSSSAVFFQPSFWNVRLLVVFVSSAHNWPWILYLDHCYSILFYVLTLRQNVFEITDFLLCEVWWQSLDFAVVWCFGLCQGLVNDLPVPTNVILYASLSNWWGNISTQEDETKLSWNTGHQLSSDMVPHWRRTETSTTLLWKCNNSHDFAPWCIM